jgi:hypothetical protein
MVKPICSFSTVALAFAGAMAIGPTASAAGSITYTESGLVQYEINGGAIQGGVNGALLTITETADTSGVLNFSPVFENKGTATFTLGSLAGTFTDSMAVDDEQNVNLAGFSDISDAGAFVLTTTDSAFGSYELATAIGPVTDTAGSDTGVGFPTTLGVLSINIALGDTTFTATTSTTTPPVTTPEPASMTLLGMALVGLGLARRRRA